MKTSMKSCVLLGAALSSIVLSACGGQDPQGDGSSTDGAGAKLGRLNAALSVPEEAKHDVAMAQFLVVAADGDCSDDPIAQTTAAIEEEALVGSLDMSVEPGYRAFVDGLMTLPPGDYKVCVQPLKADGTPSDECDIAQGNATVFPELTTEIVLVSQCDGIRNGALDVVATLNDPPIINDIKIEESKFITTCETATITIEAEDANKDALTYEWEQVSGPAGGMLVASDASASFSPAQAGDYEFKVTVYDVTGASSSLTFPIHVSEADGACLSPCPDGTIDAAGYCFVQAQPFESGVASCARVGLTGAASFVEGFKWTPTVMAAVTQAIGCTNGGQVSCCQSALYIDTATNTCTTNGFAEDNGQDFVNALTLPGRPAAMHVCQRP